MAKTKELGAKLAKKDHVIAEVPAELVATKSLGSPERPLVPHDLTVVAFVRVWLDNKEIAAEHLVA